MSADDEVHRIAQEVVNGALGMAFPQASLTELAAAARLMGLPSVFMALEAAEQTVRNLGARIAAAELPMTEPDRFWAWYREHAGTVWAKGRAQRAEQYKVAAVPQLRYGRDGWNGPERWAWQFDMTEVGKTWSRETIRYPNRLLEDTARQWTPVEPADGDVLALVCAAELALHGEATS